jgi:hypothetical protein
VLTIRFKALSHPIRRGIVDWMDRQRALWERLFDAVDNYLKEERP